MIYAQTRRRGRRYFVGCVTSIAAILLIAPVCRGQGAPASQQTETPWSRDLKKYPELLPELGQLVEKLQQNVRFPAARSESQLLPLLPQSTMSLGAFPNYGDAAQQALKIFHQELQQNAVLRDWWEHGELAPTGHKVEDFLEKFSQLNLYLGDEIVVSGAMEGANPSLLVVAKVRKPGLDKFLPQMVEQLAGKSKTGVRVFDAKELAAAKDSVPPQELLVLARPDYAVAALDLATLRSFNARLDQGAIEFVSTPFGQRAVEEYRGGLTILVAVDLQNIVSQVPAKERQNPTFQKTGFADVKYLIWDHKSVADKGVSQMELSFTGPRHGIASWLAKSGPLGSLDFVSPDAKLVSTWVLKNPAQIFEDVKALAGASGSNAFAAIEQFERALNLSVKDDLLSLLSGELTVEVGKITPPMPEWRASLGVKDANRLQQTMTALLAAGQMEAEHKQEGGVTYHTIQIPSQNAPMEISYAFVDSYLVIGSGRNKVAEAVRLHRSGGSLAKSKTLLASLPPGHSLEASGLFYMDPTLMTALQLQKVAPEMAESLLQSTGEVEPTVVCVYGEEAAIRETSNSSSFDIGGTLIVAAIAIPNLLRSKIAANEASAVGSLRTVNTVQVTYAATYPERGFAPNLATLGPVPGGTGAPSPEHADLLDEILANESCTGDAFCRKTGYLFRIASVCKKNRCDEYVVVATPVTPGTTGTRSFCSTSDGIIRVNSGPSVTAPLTAEGCKAWAPI